MPNAREMLHEYGMLQAQVIALQGRMADLEARLLATKSVGASAKRQSLTKGSTADRVRDYIKPLKEVTSDEVRKALGFSTSSEAGAGAVYAALSYFADQGQLKKLSKGRYRVLAASAKEAA